MYRQWSVYAPSMNWTECIQSVNLEVPEHGKVSKHRKRQRLSIYGDPCKCECVDVTKNCMLGS